MFYTMYLIARTRLYTVLAIIQYNVYNIYFKIMYFNMFYIVQSTSNP